MSDTFLRYIVLLGEIPCSPRRVGAAELTSRLQTRGIHVTRRTVQRDLERLSSILPIACNDSSKPYRWAWIEHATAKGARNPPNPEPSGSVLSRLGRAGVNTLPLVVRFTEPAPDVLAQIPAPRRVQRVDGWLLVEADVADTLELRAWLLGFGARAEVLGPAALRWEFRKTVTELGRMYG